MRALRWLWEDVEIEVPRFLVCALGLAVIDATIHVIARAVEALA